MTISDKPLYVIVDGNSFLYRAFHSLPPLTNKDGEPTGAITGVLNMITSIINNLNPEEIVITFDAKGKNFRHELFPEYKANRPPMPDDLRSQVPVLKNVIKAWGLPMLSIVDVEADDTMCTLAVKAEAKGFTAVMSTSDKDMRQSVTKNILILDTKSISDNGMPFGIEGVIEKEGVPPELIRDKLALMGDKVDNVPGIHKCGDKTAVKWLLEYGSMQGVIDNADKIGGKIGEYLREGLEQLPLSYQLVTINTNVDIPEDFSGEFNEDDLDALIKRYELNNFKKSIGFTSSSAMVFADEFTLVDDFALFSADTSALDKMVVSPHNYQGMVYFSAYTPSNKQCMLFDEATLKDLTWALTSCNTLLSLDLKTLFKSIPPKLLHEIDLHDMSIAEYNLAGANEGTKAPSVEQINLKHVSGVLTSLRSKYKLETKTPKLDKATWEEFAQIVAEEACLCNVFFESNKEKLKQDDYSPSYKVDLALAQVLASMEVKGVHINAEGLSDYSVILAERINALEAEIFKISGEEFNIDSPKQVAHILYDVLEIPSKKRTTAEPHLLTLMKDNPIIEKIMDYRSVAKLKSTFVDGLLSRRNELDDLHTTYNQNITSTGRLSSTDPNLQNIPVRTEDGRRIREAFIPRDGYKALALDYSQIEIRVLAHLSQDPVLVQAFLDDKDIHTATAAEIMGISIEEVTDEQRRAAKAINFGLIYGMGAKKLAKELGIAMATAKEYMERYFSRFVCIVPYFEAQLEQVQQNLYVKTLSGRKLSRVNVNTKDHFKRAHAELSAKNARIQGTAADIIKEAMLACFDEVKDRDDVHMIMQVHDELIFEVLESEADKWAEILSNLMANAVKLSVPLKVDYNVGKNWLEAH